MCGKLVEDKVELGHTLETVLGKLANGLWVSPTVIVSVKCEGCVECNKVLVLWVLVAIRALSYVTAVVQHFLCECGADIDSPCTVSADSYCLSLKFLGMHGD